MKTLLSLSIALILFGFSSGLKSQTVPLYLNINSHNETDDPNDYSQSSAYFQVKSRVLEIADTITQNGACWNMQVESNFILGCINNENAATNPNDLLDSLDNLNNIEVDPHNHFDPNVNSMTYNPYNYADLAHLLDSCGLATPRKNMGGFLWQTASDWMPYQAGDTGYTFTNYIWQPNVIWGGGSPGHTNDYNAYGIWKPAGAGIQFSMHNPARHLTCVGNGCSNVLSDSTPVSDNINQLINLINYISSQPYDANAYWTASVQFNFRNINMPGLADSIAAIIHAMEPYVNSGQVVWMTTTQKYDNWYTLHTNVNDHFLSSCDSLTLGVDDPQNSIATAISLFPNPADHIITLSSGTDPVTTVTIIDMNGRLIYRKDELSQNQLEVPLDEFAPGLYLVNVQLKSGVLASSRFVRQ